MEPAKLAKNVGNGSLGVQGFEIYQYFVAPIKMLHGTMRLTYRPCQHQKLTSDGFRPRWRKLRSRIFTSLKTV